MHIARSVANARQASGRLPRPLGLVPTMGYLHQGHLSLVRAARRENASVAVSIFVNPAQFGPTEDFARYPRDFERDAQLLDAEGVDLVFAPEVADMYPEGHQTFVLPGRVAEGLEGAARPGHFRGVDTIVLKLFNILQPARAYFGRKDAQQLATLRKMVADLDVPVEIRALPTIREADGLALSSRNVYLSAEERPAALVLSRALAAAQRRFQAGERRAETLREVMRQALAAEPLASPEYVSVAGGDSLDERESAAEGDVASLAVRIGRTRLIDNVILQAAREADDL
ncbi:MAG: pantoate--beta-alanine ligase [Chloroflexota bacterium]